MTVGEVLRGSIQTNEPGVNALLNIKPRLEAAAKYWKAIGSQAARSILQTTEKDVEIPIEPTSKTLEDPEGLGTNLAQPGTDLELIQNLFFSFARTRSKLIGSALKPFESVEVPDIEGLPRDLKIAKFQAFHDE